MVRKNIISKCKSLVLMAVLMIGLLFAATNMDKLEVSAVAEHTVTFDYNTAGLSSNMPYDKNGVMIASVTNRTVDMDTGYLTNVSQYNPSNLFNPYYTYKWTYNGQPVDISSVEINKDTTFVLSWTAVKYHVNFYFANDEIKSMVTNLVERIDFTVESPRIELYEPNIPNYHFDGWYSGSTHIDMLYLAPGSTGDKNYTARFTPSEFTINYNTSAKNTDNPKHYNVTDDTIILAEPSQEGHIFKGWYTDNNYTTQVSMIDTTKGGNINLYPLWELEKYTVTYIMPDGYSRKVEVEYGKKAKLPEIEKNIFEIVITDVSRKNITEDTTIKIKVVNIWYVYVLAVAAIAGIVAAIIVNKKKKESVHENLRNRYQSGPSRTRATVSIIEKIPVTTTKSTKNKTTSTKLTKPTTTTAKSTTTKPSTKVESKPIVMPTQPKPITRNNPASSMAKKLGGTNKPNTKK